MLLLLFKKNSSDRDFQVATGMITSNQGLSAKIYTDIVHAAAFFFTPSKKLNTIFYYGRCSSTTVLALEIDVGIPGSMRVVLLSMFVRSEERRVGKECQ